MVRPFLGEVGRRLWANMTRDDRLARLGFPLGVKQLEERARWPELIEFIVTAAWGYNSVSDAAYKSRVGRFRYLFEKNPDIYRLHVREDEELRFEVECDDAGRRELVNLGHLWGFTAVMPLTERGYKQYVGGEVAASGLTFEGGHILPYGQGACPAALLITGAVYFPSIHRIYSNPRRMDYPNRGYEVLVDLMRHLGRFLPRVRIAGSGDGRKMEVDGQWEGAVPPIISFATGHGVGEWELRRAGFLELGQDRMGNTKWVFNPEDINDPATPLKRRRKMLTMVELMSESRDARY